MKYHALLSLLTLSLLAGCSSKNNVVPDLPPSQLYSEAQTSIHSGKWLRATEKLEALDSRYPFGAYSQQVQLDLIYVYYKNTEYALALATINRFMRLNPTHNRMDWVLYMRGLTYMAQDANFMQDMFDIDRSDRDPEPSQTAFSDFKKLLTRYPNSIYAKDAQQRMFSLKNRLADYDLATARYYIKREAWISAINRCQELQKAYPDTTAARESLAIQLEAYRKLNLAGPVARTEQLIGLNPVSL
jgi:outer membrane protein assembly factor BamD